MPHSPFRRGAVAALAILATACGGSEGSSKPPPPPLACAPNTPQESALPAGQVLALGTHAVGSSVSFTVPAGTGSVSIVQQGVDPLQAMTITYQGATFDNTVVPLRVSVNGTGYYDDYVSPCSGMPCDPATWGSPNGIGSIYYGGASAWTGTMTVPNTSNALTRVASTGGVPAGLWTVVVNDFASECGAISSCVVGDSQYAYPAARYDVKVLLKPGTVGASGTMDLRFTIVATSLTAAQARAPGSAAQRMVSTLGTLLASAGITLGTVEFVDAPDAVKTKYATGVDADSSLPCSDIAEILQLAGAGNRMNIFLVNDLYSGQGTAGTSVVGVDGTIPGPSSLGGTLASGALVSAAYLTNCTGPVNLRSCGADRTAYIVAHETGHFLGLYHVTESTGQLFDPVTDTATCPCATCRPASATQQCRSDSVPASSAYAMLGSDCTKSASCGGGENLMFWLFSSASTGAISDHQGRIMRANPLIQ